MVSQLSKILKFTGHKHVNFVIYGKKKHNVFEISSRLIEISSIALENSKITRVGVEFWKMSEIFCRIIVVYSYEMQGGNFREISTGVASWNLEY